MALKKRDIYFFLERLSEQTNSFIKYQYKKQIGIFRNFKVKGGNVKLTSYVLQTITRPSGIVYSVSVYNALAQLLYKYHIEPLPCLISTYKISQLSFVSSNQYSNIYQDLSYNVNKLNTLDSRQLNIIAQDLIYNVSKLRIKRSNIYSIFSQNLTYNIKNLNYRTKTIMEELSCLVNYTITKQ